MDENDSRDLVEQVIRGRAHGRLIDWGQHRDADLEGAGWSPNSATERMRQRAHGGDSSTRPNKLTTVERDVSRIGKTLQTELAVRALRPKIRDAIHARYAQHRTLTVWADENGVSAVAARKRVSRGLLEVGSLLKLWRPGAAPIETVEGSAGDAQRYVLRSSGALGVDEHAIAA
jgi:hypothetical protein